jgi:hypothetical protein
MILSPEKICPPTYITERSVISPKQCGIFATRIPLDNARALMPVMSDVAPGSQFVLKVESLVYPLWRPAF